MRKGIKLLPIVVLACLGLALATAFVVASPAGSRRGLEANQTGSDDTAGALGHRNHDDEGDDEQPDGPGVPSSRIAQGFEIAPVPLDLAGKNRAMVGLGSYLVNAVGSCNDCHSCPSYAPGHSPYFGGDGEINAENYLAGGVPFGPFISANLTPVDGEPEGHSLEEFITTIRTGHDPDDPSQVLQVMPWPVLRNMTDHDLRSIYEYLRAIPPAQPGQNCTGAGE